MGTWDKLRLNIDIKPPHADIGGFFITSGVPMDVLRGFDRHITYENGILNLCESKGISRYGHI